MRALFFSITVIVLAGSLLGCASLPMVGTPKVRSVSPRITGLDFEGVNLVFDVDVDNPYPVAIRVPGFKYGVDVEGSRFFDSETTSRINLPAIGVGTVSLPARISYIDLLNTYESLSGKAEADYTLRGTMILPILGQSLELPISHSGTFPILRPPTFSDVNVGLGKVSLFKTTISVDAMMRNPNAFPLGVEALGYVLKLGGTELGGLTATTGGSLKAGGSGRLSLKGEISAANALFSLLRTGSVGAASILPTGSIETPYGPVKLQR